MPRGVELRVQVSAVPGVGSFERAGSQSEWPEAESVPLAESVSLLAESRVEGFVASEPRAESFEPAGFEPFGL